MTNDNINITITNPIDADDKWTPEQDSAIRKAKDYLRRRFYKTGMSGSQYQLYDSLNDTPKLWQMHLIECVLSEVDLMAGQFKWAKQAVEDAVKDGTILPISMEVQRYRPNKPSVVNERGICYRNLWRPPEIAPLEGDAGLFEHFIRQGLGYREEEAEYLTQWLALLVQDPMPKRKPPVAIYLFSEQQGHGKSLLAHIMTQVLGEEAVQISSGPQALSDKNRIQFWSRSLFVADEAKIESKDQAVTQAFKNLITSSQTDEALKNQQVKKHEVPARLMMLSNSPPMHLEPNDRRYFVARWETGLEEDKRIEYFKEFERWLNKDGFGIISHYLATYDVSGWDNTAVAMVTDAKREALSLSQDRVEKDVRDLIEERGYWFVDLKRDFNSLDDVNPNQLKHVMSKLGWRPSALKNGVFRPNQKDLAFNEKRTSHHFWFCPEAKQARKEGMAHVIEYGGDSYSYIDLYRQTVDRVAREGDIAL